MDTPNLDKMRLNKSESQAIGEFLEWLGSKGLVLGMTYNDLTDQRVCMQCAGSGVKGSSAKPCSNCDGEGYYTIRLDPKFMPASFNIDELLADYFDVDLKAAEQEKRAILAEFQRMHS